MVGDSSNEEGGSDVEDGEADFARNKWAGLGRTERYKRR